MIWNNFGLNADDLDLNSYQLSARVFDLLDLEAGPIITLHNTRNENDKYIEDLEALEYDMIYGDYSIFGGENPYVPSDMRLGLQDIVISQATNHDGNIVINGERFTESSIAYINDDKCETEYVNSNTLIIKNKQLEESDTLDIRQVADDTTVFGIYTYNR